MTLGSIINCLTLVQYFLSSLYSLMYSYRKLKCWSNKKWVQTIKLRKTRVDFHYSVSCLLLKQVNRSRLPPAHAVLPLYHEATFESQGGGMTRERWYGWFSCVCALCHVSVWLKELWWWLVMVNCVRCHNQFGNLLITK